MLIDLLCFKPSLSFSLFLESRDCLFYLQNPFNSNCNYIALNGLISFYSSLIYKTRVVQFQVECSESLHFYYDLFDYNAKMK